MAWQLCCRSCTSRDALIITMRRQRLRAEVLRLRARIAKRVVRSTRPLCKASPSRALPAYARGGTCPQTQSVAICGKASIGVSNSYFSLLITLSACRLRPAAPRWRGSSLSEALKCFFQAGEHVVPLSHHRRWTAFAGPRLDILRVDLRCVINAWAKT